MTEQRVFIIDDDPAVRDALVTLVESVGLTAEDYASADEFLDSYSNETPGCLITDICLPGMDGLQLQQVLQERDIQLPLIAISAHGDIAMAVKMVRRNAIDFIEKPFRNHIMLQRIHEALDIDHQQRLQRARDEKLKARLSLLTPREKQTLNLLLDGKSNKIIAAELSLSPRTVEAHRANILKKMHADSVTALANQINNNHLLIENK
ncbi:response regulator transcription factor [Sedimenticola thiotaurini]|uniref:Response regulator transcription factor n=1 Tax=Sedimenticola thiotaurini TaxID=1543721 RepID=A0A0F7JV98_9GAMM|nr:response regulator [Sedimenticola thiotaurini]AKH19254.1 hypothetical protein AAY24_01615 [Sedimenticola thiotaurini]